jgi:hypothetical protein
MKTSRSPPIPGDEVKIESGGKGLSSVVAATGEQPKENREEMRAFLDRAERRYGPLIAKWSGDTAAFPGLRAMTSRLFL